MASAGAVGLFTVAGAVTGCGSTDCNDTATCAIPGDDAFVSQDAFIDANDGGAAAIDSAADTSDDDVLTTDIMVDSSDGTLDTGSGDADAADDVIDGTTGTSDGADAGPPPADTGIDAPPDVPPPPKCKSNVLALKAAVASSITAPNVAAEAIDSNFNTRWESAQGSDPQWIYVDFGAPVFINRVQILWLHACAANYDIQVSNSTSSGWTTSRSIVGNMTGSSVSPTDWTTAVDHTGLVGVGRYLRVFGTKRCDTSFGYSMWEIQVSGDTNPICTP
jgi:hypothetical protein